MIKKQPGKGVVYLVRRRVVSLLRPGGGLSPVSGGHFDRFFQPILKKRKNRMRKYTEDRGKSLYDYKGCWGISCVV